MLQVTERPVLLSSEQGDENAVGETAPFKKIPTGPVGVGSLRPPIRITATRVFAIVGVVLAVTLLDIFYFIVRSKPPEVEKAEVTFEPVDSDLMVTAAGPINKDSYLASFDVLSGSCAYHYRPDQVADFRPSGELLFVFPTDTNDAAHYHLDLKLVDTNYASVRRILWDLQDENLIASTASVKLDCTFELAAELYGVVPLSYAYDFSYTMMLRDIDMSKSGGMESNFMSDKNILDILRMDKFATNQAVFSVFLELGKGAKPKYPFQSFVFNVPAISYSVAFVDISGQPKSYLTVASQPISVDLMQAPLDVTLAAEIFCSPYGVYEDNAEISSNTVGDCTYFTPLNLFQFRHELLRNKFLNVTAHSNSANFLSKFIGEQHYIRSVPDDGRFAALRKRDRSMHALTAIVPGSDSNSTDGNCLIIDTDDMSLSQACIDAGSHYFKLSVTTYDDDGYRANVESITAWNSFDGLWFESQLLMIDRDEDSATANLVFSEAMQNLSFVAAVNASGESLFLENLYSQWNFQSVDELSDFVVFSYTDIDGVAPITILSNLTYGMNTYGYELFIASSENETSVDQFLVNGNGRYGGSWMDW